MAQQIKNTFLKSKMNKDLDDRILPNGEYRDARNISVGRSEDDDVGAIENIIGNNLVTGTDIGAGLTIIGVKNSNSTDQIFVFLTDYTDPDPTNPTDAPSTSKHYIYVYDNTLGNYTLLVQGEFLNFSTTNRIIGINLIENLLFWTDNRNQPRKINIALFSSTAQSGRSSNITTQEYYTQEHQISVAKYSPYQAIQLYNRINVETSGSTASTTAYFTLDGDQVAALTPFIDATVVSAEQATAITGLDHIKVTGVNLVGAVTRVSVSPAFGVAPAASTYISLIISTMTNKINDSNWPGDPDYLEDKFVRFSYRFKYDDNEYSLMAPFTQIAYIPKQGGFFINGDEDAAYQSTVVNFMENNVQNIGLVIPLPTNANRIVRDYKISEVEILFRESDAVAVKVLESITAGEISGASGTSNYYTYDYQSRKPYKTLPEAQTVRVYDKVPVRAFSQESSGNRIIYGNYRDQHTPPANINYNCRISPKSSSGKFANWIEYPNHSVKRNRNYQVGFVLADKFGRQSPVILSSVDNGSNNDGLFYFGSTIYSPYDINDTDTSVINWFGDAISVLVNSEIASTKNLAEGTPGLYAIKQNAAVPTAEGYATTVAAITSDTTYTFILDENPVTGYPNNINIPRENDYLRGAYEDFVKVITIVETNPALNFYEVTTTGRVNDVYLRADNLPASTPDLKFAYTINDLGWYSYKIVVKQTQQEYYNVYLPGILNGYPGQSGATNAPSGTAVAGGIDNGLFPTDETNLTAFTVLFNDNINKIPRDLSEVGPDQKQYRSSVTLFGRVTNLMTISSASPPFANSVPYNSQYYARISSQGKTAISHTSTAIARAKEVNMGYSDLSDNFQPAAPAAERITGGGDGDKVFYQIDTNPLITRISTLDKSIGATALNEFSADNINVPTGTANMLPYLAIYETAPVESLLDIYWETASEGLIVDLNADVLSGSGGATTFKDVTWLFDETTANGDFVTTSFFQPVNEEGEIFALPTDAELISQTNGNGDSVELFELFKGTGANDGEYKIKYIGTNPMVFGADSRTLDVYTFIIQVTTNAGEVSDLTLQGQVEGFGALKNIAPTYNDIPNFATTKDTRIILPGIPGTKWTTADPKNGSGYTAQNTAQLEYTISSFDAAEPIPDNWEMERDNGELTQAIAGDGDFEGNPKGTYKANITVTDANGISFPSTGATGYTQLSVTHRTDINIGYASVNASAKSGTCTVNPNPSAPTSDVIVTNTTPVTGLWYITAQNNSSYLAFDDFYTTYGITASDKIRIGTGAHESGTLAITANFKQENLQVGAIASKFKLTNVHYYYRTVDTSGGRSAWQFIPRSGEFNRSGIGGQITAPSYNDPKYFNPPFEVVGGIVGQGISKWLQLVRAFNFLQITEGLNVASVEYAFVIEGLQQTQGNSNQPVAGWISADDLHYPSCIPWQGANIASSSYYGANNEYRYFRAAPGDTNPNITQPVNTNILYAETPFGEYVDQFYTDSAMENAYLPGSGTEFVSFELDLNYGTSGIGALTDYTGFAIGDMTWSTKLNSSDGVRAQNAEGTVGVNTTPTFLNYASEGPNNAAGLSRINTTQ